MSTPCCVSCRVPFQPGEARREADNGGHEHLHGCTVVGDLPSRAEDLRMRASAAAATATAALHVMNLDWPCASELDEHHLFAIDPGIRLTVLFMRAIGYNTTDSGDGVTKGEIIAAGYAMSVPHVFAVLADRTLCVAGARRLHTALMAVGITVEAGQIQASYDPVDERVLVMLFGVEDSMFPGAGGGARRESTSIRAHTPPRCGGDDSQ